MAATKMDPALHRFLVFLNRHPEVRHKLAAPKDKTIVYCGNEVGPDGESIAVWQHLDLLKRQDPQKHDYVTVTDRLRNFHVTAFGESLWDHANWVSKDIECAKPGDEGKREAVVIWRAPSGIDVQGARGRVRTYVKPDESIKEKVLALVEVKLLTRPDVLEQIETDAQALHNFRIEVLQSGRTNPVIAM